MEEKIMLNMAEISCTVLLFKHFISFFFLLHYSVRADVKLQTFKMDLCNSVKSEDLSSWPARLSYTHTLSHLKDSHPHGNRPCLQ